MWQEMCKETVTEATIFFTRGWPTGNHGTSCKRRRGSMERSLRVRMEEESLKFSKSLNVLIGNNLRTERIMTSKIHLNI
jgi:hypothetical protein